MALPATGVLEVNGVTGNDLNGALFDPAVGTNDLTYPTSAPISFTDLVIGATNTQVSSATTTLTQTTHGGNTFNVPSGISGFTAGLYNIRSVSGGVATLDRAIGTASTAQASGTIRLGGACATPAMGVGSVVAGNTVYCKDNGTSYDLGSGLTFNNVTGARLWGYGTTRGDGGRAKFTTSSLGAFNTLILLPGFGGSPGWHLRDITVDMGSRANCPAFTGSLIANTWERVWFLNCAYTLGSFYSTCVLIECRLEANTTNGVLTSNGGNSGNLAQGCVFKLPGGGGNFNGIEDCLLLSCGSFTVPQGGSFEGNTVYQSAAVSAASTQLLIKNNLFHSGTGVGLTAGSALGTAAGYDGNWYYNNASGARSSNVGATGGDTRDVLLTADPCVSVSTSDFRPNNNAGGGANLRGKAYPQTLLGLGSVANNRDAGAYQHADPTGGGGGGLLKVGMTGGLL